MLRGPDPDFYIFYQMGNYFFHILQREDWKIAEIPLDKIDIAVNKTYVACNAVLAAPPHIPTDLQKDAMTSAQYWIEEKLADPPKYQLALEYAPEHANSSFIHCFDSQITNWVNDFFKERQAHDNQMAIAIVGGVVLVGLLVMAGCFWYMKYRENHRNYSEIRTSPSLFRSPDHSKDDIQRRQYSSEDPNDFMHANYQGLAPVEMKGTCHVSL